MATFDLKRSDALRFLQRDMAHMLQKLDADVPSLKAGEGEAKYNERLLAALIAALGKLQGRSNADTRAAMSLEDGQYVGKDPMADYLNRYGRG